MFVNLSKNLIDDLILAFHVIAMFLHVIFNQPDTLTPLILLLAILVINIYTEPLILISGFKWHPQNLVKNLIIWFDLKLNRDNRSSLDRLIRGGLTLLIILFLSSLFGYSIAWLSQNIRFAWILEALLLHTFIDQCGIYKKILIIYKLLKTNDLASARQIIFSISSEPMDKVDSYIIARSAIELLATSLIIRVIAPVFWYVLFGAIGIVIYHSINIINHRIGHNITRYRDFGFATRHLNTALLFFPSLITGHLIVIASLFIPKATPIKSYKSMVKYTRKYHKTNLGFAISAFAGALGLALAGPKTFNKKTMRTPWIGDGSAMVTHNDIRRSLYLSAIVCLFNGLLVATIILTQQD